VILFGYFLKTANNGWLGAFAERLAVKARSINIVK